MSVVIVDACTKEQAAHNALRLLQFPTLLFIFVLLIPFFPSFYWFSLFLSYAFLCFVPNLARAVLASETFCSVQALPTSLPAWLG